MRPAMVTTRILKGGRLALVFALLCWGLSAWPAPTLAATVDATKGQIVPGKSVGGISLGMSEPDVTRAWGPPERTEQSPDGIALYDYGEKQGVGVFVAGNRVTQIMVVGRDWNTTNGLKVGSTRPEVLAFYGRPDEEFRGEAPDEFRYWYKRHGLVFMFKNRTVAGITVIAAEAIEGPRGGLPPDDPAARKPFLPTPTPPRY